MGPNVWNRRCLVSKAVNGLTGTLRVVRRLNRVRGPWGQPTAVPNDRSRHQPFRNSPRVSNHFFLMIRFLVVQPPATSHLVDLKKCHIMESRYEFSGEFSGSTLTSSHADTLIRNGAAPHISTDHDTLINRVCRSRRHSAAACPAPRNSPAPRLARSSGRCPA